MCKATFHTRIRVQNHVRSSGCRNKVGDLPDEIIKRYRKADAAEIRTARLDGRSAQEGAQRVMTARCVQVGSHGCDEPYATSLTVYRMATCITRVMRAASLMGDLCTHPSCGLFVGTWVRLRRCLLEFYWMHGAGVSLTLDSQGHVLSAWWKVGRRRDQWVFSLWLVIGRLPWHLSQRRWRLSCIRHLYESMVRMASRCVESRGALQHLKRKFCAL